MREASNTPSGPMPHDHAFLTFPGRCIFCGISSEEMRAQAAHHMLVEAFNRLASVLERVEAKL